MLSLLQQSADETCMNEKQTKCYDCLNTKSDLLITKYVICNDTNLCLKFGQIDTEENIILESRKCHLYFWRMPNTKHLLRLAINLSDWKFSEGTKTNKNFVIVQMYYALWRFCDIYCFFHFKLFHEAFLACFVFFYIY